MKKRILIFASFLLVAFGGSEAAAQGVEKKEAEKPKTTTVDAWRDAVPQSEQPAPVLVMEESKDNVESEEQSAQIEKRILDLERRLMEATRQRDAVSLNSLLADDFVAAGVAAAEPPTNKARFIEWAEKNLVLKSYVLDKITVRVFQTAAVVTFNYKRQATLGGSPSDGDFAVTNVWLKRGKRWQAVSHHVSQLSKP